MSWQKPSEQEEEYFKRLEFERLKKLAEEREQKLREGERQQLKELHWMRCPKCGMELVEIEYLGLKIDKCTSCAGVWLDCGELEQIATDVQKGFLGNLLKIFR